MGIRTKYYSWIRKFILLEYLRGLSEHVIIWNRNEINTTLKSQHSQSMYSNQNSPQCREVF